MDVKHQNNVKQVRCHTRKLLRKEERIRIIFCQWSTHPLVQRLMVLVVCRDGSVESWQALGQSVAGPHGVVSVLQPHPTPLPRDAQVQRASQLKIFRNFTINTTRATKI